MNSEKITETQNQLDKLQNLSYEKKLKVINKLPAKVSTKLYLKYCSNGQLKELLLDWHLIATGKEKALLLGNNIKKIQKKHIKKIQELQKGLKKSRLSHLIPNSIKNYKYL